MDELYLRNYYVILTDCQQNATSEGETGSDVAGSLQDATLVVSPEKPSSWHMDSKPIAVPPHTCITPKYIINVIQTPGGKNDCYVIPPITK